MNLHPLAAVSPSAKLGQNVQIGPFCVVEDGVSIGDGCRLESRVVVKSGTTLGADNRIFEGAVIGGLPQHLAMKQPGTLVIGRGNQIRENVTIHRGLEADSCTTIGDENLLMINSHVAHDCHLGNNIIITNNAMLAGHITVEDRAYISGAVGIHQFCRIGRLAMVGGAARVVKDVPPFVTVDGGTTLVVGLNLLGLRRAGFSREEIAQLKEAYRLIYRSALPWKEILERLPQQFNDGPAIEFIRFFSGGRRGFTPARATATPTIRLKKDDGKGEEPLAKAG